jgi:hypothetical protein
MFVCDRYLVTAVVNLLISRSLHNNGSTRYNSIAQLNITLVSVDAVSKHVPPTRIVSKAHFKPHSLTGDPKIMLAVLIPLAGRTFFSVQHLKQFFFASKKPLTHDFILLLLGYHDSNISVPAIKIVKTNLIRKHFHVHSSHEATLCWGLVTLTTIRLLALGCLKSLEHLPACMT